MFRPSRVTPMGMPIPSSSRRRISFANLARNIGRHISYHSRYWFYRMRQIFRQLTRTGRPVKVHPANQRMMAAAVSEITIATICPCNICAKYAEFPDSIYEHASYNPMTAFVNFPKMKYEKSQYGPTISYDSLANCLKLHSNDGEETAASEEPIVVNFRDLATILTYLEVRTDENAKQSIHDLIASFYYLYDTDLTKVIMEDQMAVDLLRKTCQLFVLTWKAYFIGNRAADWCAWSMRRLLAYIISIPIISDKAIHVLSTPHYWPETGPLKLLEDIINGYLYCVDTIALLCNMTRIKGVAEFLDSDTGIVNMIRDRFYPFCRRINDGDKLADVMVHLLCNLMVIPGFPRFMVEANSGYFLQEVLLKLISNPQATRESQLAAWPLLKNLALTEVGRAHIMASIDLYLGPILYPIAGPERIRSEYKDNLPIEVQYLPKNKTRTEERVVRDCILDILFSLCRFRQDREVLRKAEVYQILKYYHLAEDDEEAIQRIEHLVNIMIRKEDAEFEFDDLLQGMSLALADSVSDAANANLDMN